jgi:hypothetical protein
MSSPFMLKARNCVIGSKIGIKVNGKLNDDVGMIVNEDYEACFIEEQQKQCMVLIYNCHIYVD